MDKLCACGCGQTFQWKPYYNWPSYKKKTKVIGYISGHNKKRNPQSGILPPTGTANEGYLYFIRNRKRVYIHKAIMEEYLGRKLTPNERIHHINHNKQDNRIENLQVLTLAEHARLHALTTRKRRNGNFV